MLMTTSPRRMLSLAAIAGALLATVAGAASKPSWQTIPVGVDERGVFFGAGRAWYYSGIESGSFRTKSARVASGRLTAWTTATLPGTRGWAPIRPHGQELLFSTPRDGVQAVKLLPNGRFGARRTFDTGAPPSAYSTGSSVIQLSDRVVQLVNYCDYLEPSAKPCRDFEARTGACCDVNGDAANYASFVKRSFEPPRLGLDRRGRLWLAWKGPREEHPAEIVQLDPETLEPRGKPTAMPGSFTYVKTIELACSETCRFVLQAFRRGQRNSSPNSTWAPGERSLTPIKLPGSRATIFGARAGPARLELAFNFSVVTPKGTVAMVGMTRSDPRGRNARLTSSIDVPESLGSFARGQQLTISPRNGAFGPGGFVTTAVYESFSGGRRPTVRATVLPLR
jgi:hypothetical protein